MEIQKIREKLRKFALVTKIDIMYENMDGILESPDGIWEDNPVVQCAWLREKLKSGAAGQKLPYIYRDDFDVFFVCLRPDGGETCYVGPLSMARLSPDALHRFYRSYGIRPDDVRSLKVLTLQEILYTAELVEETLTGLACSEEDLLKANHIAADDLSAHSRERTSFLLKEEYADDMDETWRHTYRQERRVVDAIREGRTEDALEISHMMDDDTGRLSEKEPDHWRSLATVIITVSSRAAIEGGLAPGTAYRLSGYYIRKCNACRDIAQLIRLRDEALQDFSERVREKKERGRTSNYTEVCKNYIAKHYREKIYLDEAAKVMGISPTYLSHLFKRDTDIRFQDYVNQVRVERSSNLLRYSDMGLSDIAEYVGFPSQSYFGKIFKAQTHMTPKEYRDRFKAAEWSEEAH